MTVTRRYLYAIVLRFPSGRHADGGIIQRARRLRDGATVEYDGERWRIDHIVPDAEPPLVYLVPGEAE